MPIKITPMIPLSVISSWKIKIDTMTVITTDNLSIGATCHVFPVFRAIFKNNQDKAPEIPAKIKKPKSFFVGHQLF